MSHGNDPRVHRDPSQRMPEGWQSPSVGTIENFRRSQRLGEVATHHPVLRQRAREIPRDVIQSGVMRALEYKLQSTAERELEAGRRLVGLAAPQIGEGVRAFIAQFTTDPTTSKDSELTLMINPEIEPWEDDTRLGSEGCFSCGPLAGIVERPSQVRATWFDLGGKRHEEAVSDFRAVILGHENDHLDGILFPDHVISQGREIAWVNAEEALAYGQSIRSGEPWQPTCPVDQWEAMNRPDDAEGPIFRLEAFSVINQD